MRISIFTFSDYNWAGLVASNLTRLGIEASSNDNKVAVSGLDEAKVRDIDDMISLILELERSALAYNRQIGTNHSNHIHLN